MTDKKTPEQRAEEHASKNLSRESWRWLDAKSDFLAGRADFIQNDLPKLLEMAREETSREISPGVKLHVFDCTIEQLLAMAEKGETWNEVTAKP